MYIFIDPGKNTGWAIFDDNGNEVDIFTTRSFEKTCEKIGELIKHNSNLQRVLPEEFKLYPDKATAQIWSPFETVQVIGAIRFRCWECQVDYETVPAKNYPMGFRYMGMEVPNHRNPLHDQLVAMAHGVFWLQNKGIRIPRQGQRNA